MGILTDYEDMINLINIIKPCRAGIIFRQREKQFEKWNDQEFIVRFRLSTNGVRFLLENIG